VEIKSAAIRFPAKIGCRSIQTDHLTEIEIDGSVFDSERERVIDHLNLKAFFAFKMRIRVLVLKNALVSSLHVMEKAFLPNLAYEAGQV